MLCRCVNVSDQWTAPSPQAYNDQVIWNNLDLPFQTSSGSDSHKMWHTCSVCKYGKKLEQILEILL